MQLDPEIGAKIQESAAVYSNEPREMMLTGSGDGIAIPSEQIESGIRSITTDDIHNMEVGKSNVASWHMALQIVDDGTQ